MFACGFDKIGTSYWPGCLLFSSFKGLLFLMLFLSILLDEKMTFWLKSFIDWLRGLIRNGNCSNVNRNFHFIINYLIQFLTVTADILSS